MGGHADFSGLCELIKESVALNEKSNFVESVYPEDTPLDKFLRDTENHRRERQQCVDAGDESALLKFQKPPPAPRGGAGAQRGGYQSRSGAGGGRDDRGAIGG